MGSFGQGSFGQTQFGGIEPNVISFINIGEINAESPVLEFSADSVDTYENITFEVRIQYGGSLDETFFATDVNWDPMYPVPTGAQGGTRRLSLPFSLDPSNWYSLNVKATPDPDLNLWWGQKSFVFMPVADPGSIDPIESFFLYESDAKAVNIPEFGTSTTDTPYAEWVATGLYDYFAWNVTIDRSNNHLPFKVFQPRIHLTDYPLYNDTWFIKLAKVYGGVIGPVLTFEFNVDGTVIVVT